jgi:hypothetical protein
MTIQSYSTKIIKRLLCAILIILGTYAKAFSQLESKTPSVLYDSLKKEILLLNGTDSIGSILLDKNFKATLNHEKKRKKKTVYYRLAEYKNPTHISKVPVYLASNDIVLHLQGVLQGDTNTKFNCIISEKNGVLQMKTDPIDVSVNEFSFRIKFFPNKMMQINALDPRFHFIKTEKKNYTNISIHGRNNLVFSFDKKE